MRKPIFATLVTALLLALAAGWITPIFNWLALFIAVILVLAIIDATQKRRAVLRNFPVLGRFRYLFEMIRPEINQYFVESNTDGTPFNREVRSLVYQRAKRTLDTLPFGTQRDVYEIGYEWIAHSVRAKAFPHDYERRVPIGESQCDAPYSASLLNVSAMSFGSLSRNAIQALNLGARLGRFYHNTGEGGISPHHTAKGGDLVWQVGTGYFGCRTRAGGFDPDRFQEQATLEQVKMIEVKLSQGAKPGHGGILPAVKLTREIADIRGVPMGQDVLSPPAHSAFSTPFELLQFVTDLRRLSGGKPVGIKLCVGDKREFMALCKAMMETGRHPDFITVDGGEGGTGAAPIEFSNSVGMPLTEGLVYVHNCLEGFKLRAGIRVIASGKIANGFDMAAKLALGADLCNSARAMMMALGCIQARRCNSNDCPVGVATQNPALVFGLDVESKGERVFNFHDETVRGFLELLGAAGLSDPADLRPHHVMRRIDATRVRSYAEIFPYIETGALMTDPVPEAYEREWLEASSGTF